MATEVYTTEDIKLQDGTEVTLVPLPLSKLRKFMRRWNEFLAYADEQRRKPADERDSEIDFGDKQFDTFLELTVICLEKSLKGERTPEEFADYIDNTVDEQTIYKVLERCGGLKLNDPNLQAAAEAMMRAEAAGTN